MEYAEAGWPVFPLLPQTKRPRFRGGFHGASTDPSLVGKWWERFPSDNIGVAVPEGLFVVDVDADAGGHETLARWAERHGEVFTLAVATGGGGLHLWFRTPANVRLRQGVKVWPGIDTRVHGKGYAILPPSLHESGRRYEWVSTVPPVTAPAWMVADLAERPDPPRVPVQLRVDGEDKYWNAALAGEVDRIRQATPGTEKGRNHALFVAARNLGELVAGGVGSEDEALTLLEAVALEVGLTSREIHGARPGTGTLMSGWLKGLANPRKVVSR